MEEIIYTHLPMEYKENGDTKTIGSGKIGGYEYKIKNMRGNHPTAYIKLEETHPFYKVPFGDIDIDVYGGLTYGGLSDDGYWIGWDYAHCGDYVSCCNFCIGDKMWTTDEILEHCRDVVKQLIEHEQPKYKVGELKSYTIEITETLQKQIKVLAENEDKAREIAQEVYYSGNEYLTENDLKETTFEIIEEKENG